MTEVSLRALRERHPQLRWTQHVGTHGNSYAYRGVRDGYAVTLVPYVQDCRESGERPMGPFAMLREAPPRLWLQQSNTGDPQSLYVGVLHGEAPSRLQASLDRIETATADWPDWRKRAAAEDFPVGAPDEMPPLPRDPEEWVLLG